MTRNRNRKAKSFRAAPGRRTRVKKNRRGGKDGRALFVAYPLRPTPTTGSLWYSSRVLGVPDSVRTNLRYVVPLQLVSSGTNAQAALKFSSNAYDVDAALGSTSMAYFSELATIYAKFRTLGMKYCFNVSTIETHGVQYVHGFSSTSFASSAVASNFAETPYLHESMSGGINANSTKSFNGELCVSELFGTQQALYDDLYTGSTTSNTLSGSATMYLYIGGVNPTGVAFAAGFYCTGWVELDVMLFDRNTIGS